jgi:membrane protein
MQSGLKRWWQALRRSVRDIREDELTDRAAALTYYGVLSIFPALLVLVSVLGLLGGPASALNDLIGSIAPGQAGDFITNAINQVSSTGRTAGVVAVIGLLVAFWSASGYIAAFLRAVEAMHDARGSRSAKQTLPLRLGLTAALGVLILICVFLVVLTGELARKTGEAIGIGSTGVSAWNIAKWPVLLILVAVMFALLYKGAPGRQGRRLVTPGSLTAVLLWIVASAVFGIYLATLASYQKTYGALSTVIIFLVWLWLTNLVVLLGAEVDAELGQSRHEEGAPDAKHRREDRGDAGR